MRRQELFEQLLFCAKRSSIVLAVAVALMVVIPMLLDGFLAFILMLAVMLASAAAIVMLMKESVEDYKRFMELTGEKAPEYFAWERGIRLVDDAPYAVDLEEMLYARCMPEYVSFAAGNGMIAITYRRDGIWKPGWSEPADDVSPIELARVIVMKYKGETKALSECHALSRGRNYSHYADDTAEATYALRFDDKIIAYCDRAMLSAIWDCLSRYPLSESKNVKDVTEELFGKTA